MEGPFTKAYVLMLVGIVVALLVATPWVIAVLWLRERDNPYGMHPLPGIVAIGFCLFELALLGDWLLIRYVTP